MIPDDLNQAIESKDISLVKAIILTQVNIDRLNKDFTVLALADQVNQKLLNIGVSLYQEDSGESHYTDDRSLWNKGLWGELRIDFEYNFSRQKLEKIVEVMTYLRLQGHTDFQIDESFNDGRNDDKTLTANHKQPESKSSSSEQRSNRDYYIGGGAGAIIGGVGGKLLGFGVAGLVVGVAVGLAVVYYRNNRG
jgi:hypothetical protein